LAIVKPKGQEGPQILFLLAGVQKKKKFKKKKTVAGVSRLIKVVCVVEKTVRLVA